MNNKNPPSKHHKNESYEELLARSVDFLQEKAILDPSCASLSRQANRTLNCNCWGHFFPESPEPLLLTRAVAAYMVYFSRLEKPRKQEIVMEWIRYADRLEAPASQPRHCVFILPTLSDRCLPAKIPLVCQSMVMKIIGVSTRFMTTNTDGHQCVRPERGVKQYDRTRAA